MTTVYLYHLSEPLAGHAQHYCGSAERVWERYGEHYEGRGAKMLAAARLQGITWELVRTWPGGRDLERKLKRSKRLPDLCPICADERKREQRNERLRLRIQPALWADLDKVLLAMDLDFTLADLPEVGF